MPAPGHLSQSSVLRTLVDDFKPSFPILDEAITRANSSEKESKRNGVYLACAPHLLGMGSVLREESSGSSTSESSSSFDSSRPSAGEVVQKLKDKDQLAQEEARRRLLCGIATKAPAPRVPSMAPTTRVSVRSECDFVSDTSSFVSVQSRLDDYTPLQNPNNGSSTMRLRSLPSAEKKLAVRLLYAEIAARSDKLDANRGSRP